MKVLTVIGTRPEIIKLSPLIPLLDEQFDHVLVHTGQHYSYKMDKVFFDELRLRDPDYTLEVGSGSHAEQTAKIMSALEPVIIREGPDWVLVQGDTNTTLSGAITAAKLGRKLAHVEAGCRSFNRNMPEEINRIVADHLAELLFAADQRSYDNLVAEGTTKKKIHLVGSTLTDACLRNKEYAKNSNILSKLNLQPKQYLVVTIHRAENTDNLEVLKNIAEALNTLSAFYPIVFPIHPRTKEALKRNNIKLGKKVVALDPLGYLDFLKLLGSSKLVMTDSGGIQEETVILNVPCLILRNETEWDRFVKAGRHILLGTTTSSIVNKTQALLSEPSKLQKLLEAKIELPPGTSKSIVEVLRTERPI